MSPSRTFTEIADRIWLARDDWFDVNTVVIGGEEGVLVVDTRASAAAGRILRESVAALGAGEVRAVVNTHAHFDHSFGNVAFTEVDPALAIHAHENALVEMESQRSGAPVWEGDPTDPRADEVRTTEVVVATHTFSSVAMIHLGGRSVELVHPGRGHTAGDVVVVIPDADVVVAGDLVEQSGPPAYGPDCWPHEWAASADLVLGLTGSGSLIVPGHGTVVDRGFAQEQRQHIAIVSATITDLAGTGVRADQALAAAAWPFPREVLAHAVSRGFEQLPRASRRLPLA